MGVVWIFVSSGSSRKAASKKTNPTGGSQASPPMGSLGLPRVPLPWGVRDPLPWDPLGSQGFPLPWVPSHGIPLGSQGAPPMGSHHTPHPSCFVRPGRKLTTKELTRSFLARSHIHTHTHMHNNFPGRLPVESQ